MTTKFKKNEIVMCWELSDQKIYPAIIDESFPSSPQSISKISYSLFVDYGDENENERLLVKTEKLEKHLYKLQEFVELIKKSN